VRGRGDAYYLGGLEPRAESLARQPLGFDPLDQILREGHAAGLQVHAWLNTFYLWSGDRPPQSPEHLLKRRPDWLLTDRAGEPVYRGGDDIEGAYLDPGHAEVRAFVHDVFLDVARRYPVDGIHFDFVRYPSRDLGFSDYDLAAFRQTLEHSLSPLELQALEACPDRLAAVKLYPARWAQWRRDCVTDVVRSISHDVRSARPEAVISASTIAWGAFRGWEVSDAYSRVSQDWFGWLADGLLDLAVPMTYHTDTTSYGSWIDAAVRAAGPRPLWAGVGAYLLSAGGTAEKIRRARQGGARGFSLFSYDAVTRDGKDDAYLRSVNELVPPDDSARGPSSSAAPAQ
jgi:uncharacterized lipoprotein YddW (UPF0748 family)